MDKTAIGKKVRQKPKDNYKCDQPGTSCYYNEHNLCVNCGRKKGWKRTCKQ